jgi:hypothetical protein
VTTPARDAPDHVLPFDGPPPDSEALWLVTFAAVGVRPYLQRWLAERDQDAYRLEILTDGPDALVRREWEALWKDTGLRRFAGAGVAFRHAIDPMYYPDRAPHVLRITREDIRTALLDTFGQRDASDLEQLKRDWLGDGTWDIETTTGYEAHEDELRRFRLQQERKWEEEKRQATTDHARQWGTTGNVPLTTALEELHDSIRALGDRLDSALARLERLGGPS